MKNFPTFVVPAGWLVCAPSNLYQVDPASPPLFALKQLIRYPTPLRMVRFSQPFPLPFVTVVFKGLEVRAFFAVAEFVIAVRAVLDEATAVIAVEDETTALSAVLFPMIAAIAVEDETTALSAVLFPMIAAIAVEDDTTALSAVAFAMIAAIAVEDAATAAIAT